MNHKLLLVTLLISITIGIVPVLGATDVTSITPSSSGNSGPVSITDLTGTDFQDPATVTLSLGGNPDIPATDVNVVSDTQITCILPVTGASAGTWDVTVEDIGGAATLTGGFTITDTLPTITSITPDTGGNAGDVSITDLVGTNFQSGATVTLNRSGYADIVANPVVVDSDLHITCTLPITGATVGTWNVTVENPDGGAVTLVNGFTITVTNPAVTSITPDTGGNTGDVSITDLVGTNFQSGATVFLNRTGYTDIVANPVVVDSDIHITCTLPLSGASVGTWNVTVENPDGGTGTLVDGFTITDSNPTVTSITPDTGGNTGDISITDLVGTNFQSGTTVTLNRTGYADIVANPVVVDSDIHITCTLPLSGATVGTWNITVENPDGGTGTLVDGFTITDSNPTVTSIAPDTGGNSGDVSITDLVGTNFQSGAVVTLNRTGYADIAANPVVVDSDTHITCTFPITGATIGIWNVTVENPDGGTGTLVDGFSITVTNPAVTSITPDTGGNTGDVSITDLVGTNFQSGATVTLNRTGYADIAANPVVVDSDIHITCTLPLSGATVGTWNVTVENPDGGSGTLVDGFTITDTNPTVTSITPDTGVNTGDVSITDLVGTNFQSGATVILNRTGYADITANPVVVDSDTHITCTFPITGATVGTWNVTVENPDGGTGTLVDGFTITDLSPTVTSISPATGVNTGDVSITDLVGTNFQSGAIVNLSRSGYSNITSPDVTVDSDTHITCTLPITGATVGLWTVRVENPDGLSGSLPDGFTITDMSPTITSISPATGVNTGPVSITDLVGTNFQTGAIVNLSRSGYSNITSPDVTVDSDTHITCTLPITGATIGIWNVTVENPDGLSGKLLNGFTVTDLNPTITSISPATGVNTGPVSITDLVGTNFQSGAIVNLSRSGYSNITSPDVTVDSDTHITCTLPITGAAVGTWTVWVENPDGRTGSLPGGFTITDLSPAITSITPSSGINTGPVSITNIAGTQFQSGAVVTLSRSGYPDITATSVVVVSATQITCTLPITGAIIGSWTVTVKNPDDLSGSLPGGFTILPASPTPTPTPTPTPIRTTVITTTPTPVPVPRIISVIPSSLEQGSSTSLLTINGINFEATSRVLWNGVDLKVISASITQITTELLGSNLTKPGQFVITVLNPGSSCCSFDTVRFNVTNSSSAVSLSSSPSEIKNKKNSGTMVVLVAETIPQGLSGYSLKIGIQNQTVGKISDVTAPSWATGTSITTDETGAIHIRGLDGANRIKTNALSTSLGSFTILGNNIGTTNISYTLEESYRTDGTPYPQSSQDIPVKIRSLVGLPETSGNISRLPQDINNDGLYEDLNGNRLLDLDDIIVFFDNLDFIRNNEPDWLFDYDGNRAINFNDVVTIFRLYTSV